MKKLILLLTLTIISINLLFSDEIYYSPKVFGIASQKVIKGVEIIDLRDNRLFYFDGPKKKDIGCSVLDSLKIVHNYSATIYEPECSSSARVKRSDMFDSTNEVIEEKIASDPIEIEKLSGSSNHLVKAPTENIFKNNNSSVEPFGQHWNDITKMTFYQTERISPEYALFYQLLSPLILNLGYAYSDNWGKGISKDLLSMGAIVLSNIMLEDGSYEERCCDEYGNYYYVDENESNDGLGRILLFLGIGIQIYKVYEVYNLAEQYNDNLYQSLFNNRRPQFSFNVSNGGQEVQLAINIPIN